MSQLLRMLLWEELLYGVSLAIFCNRKHVIPAKDTCNTPFALVHFRPVARPSLSLYYVMLPWLVLLIYL
jgi:hypothetical protein